MFKSLLARAHEARAHELEGGEGSLEGGFTLIELMVVLLIIAILLAIAIPTFLGVSGSAKDRSAQSSATNAMTNAIAYYQNAQTFDATSTSTTTSQGTVATSTSTGYALAAAEPALAWTNGTCTTSANPPCVSELPVDAASSNDGQGFIVAVLSSSGTCWYELNLQTNPLAYAAGNADYAATTGAFAGQTATPTGATTAGTFYAKESTGTITCSAAHAQGFTKWYTSFAATVSE
ncbi:MAG TPA: prepilin-type N-terminal cleavage/methylation domain-containing protein [Acidimicrobiales bacterium]|nr:prepilin-type N-terminal cleavage/methylation domain-containing protein [Acidimicrobiales bacterium]